MGDGGTILHSAGNGVWGAQGSTSVQDLIGIWGSSRRDVYAVGRKGTILHSTGNGTWVAQAMGKTLSTFNGVWVSPGGEVYAVGEKGVILRGR